MSELKKSQWHPPFCAAMKLELKANKKDLSFETERTLNTKPIQIDLLVIKKQKHAKIINEVGRFFRQHNIFEYKSPEDELGIDEYFKTIAYACLYKANAEKEDAIKSSDITISLIHEGMTRALISWLKRNNCHVIEQFKGIYYVTGEKVLFPTQLIISSRLNDIQHQWLTALTSKMDESKAKRLVSSIKDLTDNDEKSNADSVLYLAMKENEALFYKLKEVPEMNEALIKLMKPELDAAKNEGKSEGRAEGRAEGKTEGATELAEVTKRLKNGYTDEKLLKEGFDPDIVKSANELLAALS